MTRKDYRAIAEVLAYHTASTTPITHNEMKTLCLELCEVFKKDNPNFRSETFLQACGF
jgi:hypothetical protein